MSQKYKFYSNLSKTVNFKKLITLLSSNNDQYIGAFFKLLSPNALLQNDDKNLSKRLRFFPFWACPSGSVSGSRFLELAEKRQPQKSSAFALTQVAARRFALLRRLFFKTQFCLLHKYNQKKRC